MIPGPWALPAEPDGPAFLLLHTQENTVLAWAFSCATIDSPLAGDGHD
jgi:hypothetical protein